ncbi:hypothetical protein [Halobacteriovorax sp. HLS]|uniref:hypothetical protein n=1 Tax=Halobacteriovorax sp. HLS TaxID=2234000 RepID=UPI000FD73A15|nr:hypothetical protein [Halobacteriovorax sp. HLS]
MKLITLALIFSSISIHANYVEAPKLYTRSEMITLSSIEFKQIISEAQEILPKKQKYPQPAPGEVVKINLHWKDAGASLHEIAQIISVNKKYTKKGLNFFKKCAKDKSVMTEFAAICFTHFTVFHKLNKLGKINTKDFPQDVVNLSSVALD